MFPKQSKSFIGATCLATILLALGVSAFEKSLGPAYQCAHDFRGEFIVKNDREIVIKGLNYDGKGPGAWFHGQLRGSKGVYTTDSDKYMTLPFPGQECGRLKVGKVYKDENVTLILPISITKFQTIGILCYEHCQNFGHIVIPEDLKVDPAPIGLLITSECPKPEHKVCTKYARDGDIKPDCKAGAGQLLPNAFGLIGGILAFFALLTNRN